MNDDFIMEETIIFNECMGVNSRMAYLYRSRETGLWTAYGYSAYKTSEMAQKKRSAHRGRVPQLGAKVEIK